MSIGKELRLNHLFNPQSKRMVLITMDHGVCVSPMKEIANPPAMVEQFVAGGADAILVTPGIAKRVYPKLLGSRTSLIIRMDGTATSIGPDLTNDALICTVEGAMRLGADGIAALGVIGVERESELSHKIAMLAVECDRLALPLVTEMVPADKLAYMYATKMNRQWPSQTESVKYGARVSVELGADVVKGFYTGDKESFREVLDYCNAPYLVLSGPAADDPEVFLGFIKDAIDCGAAGVSVGRNVWTHSHPAKMVRALCRIVHENASVASVMKDL
jgi:DhnA family fructose-bisphosphate aldolase class Ia